MESDQLRSNATYWLYDLAKSLNYALLHLAHHESGDNNSIYLKESLERLNKIACMMSMAYMKYSNVRSYDITACEPQNEETLCESTEEGRASNPTWRTQRRLFRDPYLTSNLMAVQAVHSVKE